MGLPELWFLLIAFLFLGYFLLEGFDFGVGMLMPVLGRKGRAGATQDEANTRRRVVLNTIGPVWDGNEVWLITAGGALFAAFPHWYATLFSGFYLPLLLILVLLIFRAVAIEFRGKIEDDGWRAWCDRGIIYGSYGTPFLWGVAFANIVRGVDIDADKKVTSGLLDLLNPYALLGGLTMVLVFALHGAVFLGLKTGGEVRKDAIALGALLAPATVLVAGSFVLWTQLAHGKDRTWALVAVAAVALLATTVLTQRAREGWAFTATSVAITATVAMLFASLFPNVMPSTLDPAWSLTIENASSSHYTLVVLTWAAAFLAPVVMIYQGWTYWVFRKRISTHHIPPSIGLSLRVGDKTS